MKKVDVEGSVRVDLLGGTLDIPPINLVLDDVVTINVATSLKARAIIEESENEGLTICSLDYKDKKYFKYESFTKENFSSDYFGHYSFIVQIANFFKLVKGVKITLSSGSPPGAGLGGSSSMGVVLFKALAEFCDYPFENSKAIDVVRAIESRILGQGPAGYQDYYPALYGGVLALHAKLEGVEVVQHITNELKTYLNNNMILVYSGVLRKSGINNWAVYKSFFDKDKNVVDGLKKIRDLAKKGSQLLEKKDYSTLAELVSLEGDVRATLFPGIVTDEIRSFALDLPKGSHIKMCGAGGGGCFLVIHPSIKTLDLTDILEKHRMIKLDAFNL